MSRVQSQNKMGYFPTPTSQFDFIFSRLELNEKQQGSFRIMDVGCGEGIMLRAIQDHLSKSVRSHQKVVSYGIELDMDRAEKSAKILDHVVNCSFDRARLKPQNSMSFLWLNPPYENESTIHESMRAELVFLRHSLKYVQFGGVFAFCIPQNQYTESMAKAVAARCNSVQVYKFSDADYPRFKQTVLFAYRGRKSYAEEKSITEYLIQVGKGLNIPSLDEPADMIWAIPASRNTGVTFRSEANDPRELGIDLENSPLLELTEAEITQPIRVMEGKRPMLPLRVTHLAAIISAGAKNGTVGMPMLILEQDSEAYKYMVSIDPEHYERFAVALREGETIRLPLRSVRNRKSEVFMDEWDNPVPKEIVHDERHYIVGGTTKVTDVEITEDEDGNEVKTKTQRLVSVGRAFLPSGEVISLN